MACNVDKIIDAAYLQYDKFEEKVYELHEYVCKKFGQALGTILLKTYLKNYYINMQMYEIKHGEQDDSSRKRN